MQLNNEVKRRQDGGYVVLYPDGKNVSIRPGNDNPLFLEIQKWEQAGGEVKPWRTLAKHQKKAKAALLSAFHEKFWRRIFRESQEKKDCDSANAKIDAATTEAGIEKAFAEAVE